MVHQMNLRSGPRKSALRETLTREGSEALDQPVEDIVDDIVDDESGDEYDEIPDLKSQSFIGKGLSQCNVEQVWTRTSRGAGSQISNCTSSEFFGFMMFTALVILILHVQPIFPDSDKGTLSPVSNNSLFDLYKEYPQHKSFWEAINITYKTCTRAEKPGVILVLHNKDGCLANCLVNHSAKALSKLLGVNENGQFYLVDGKTAHVKYEVASFLNYIMVQRQSLGVVVFTHLEQMDSELAKKLHFVCDRDPNISDKAILILLLKVDMQSFEAENLSEVAVRELEKLWGNKLKNRLPPIIGRITNIVAGIDETIVTKCP